jgi:hypothetical protein
VRQQPDDVGSRKLEGHFHRMLPIGREGRRRPLRRSR